MLTVKMIWFV